MFPDPPSNPEDRMAQYIDHDAADSIRALFVGRRVTKVDAGRLRLDDGTELQIVPNEGCGGCTAGWYELTALNGCDNVITRAEVEVQKNPDDKYEEEFIYTLFVYAENQKINLATVEGDDGNGYYGTGFEIVVTPAPLEVDHA
jgi:hypothetical protein